MKKWAFILCFGLASCYTEQKAKNQFSKAAVAYPAIATGYCAEQFPDKPDSVIVKTDTVTEVIFMDSLVNNTDTLYRDSLGLKYRTIYKTQKIYIKKDSIIYRENTAAVKACEIDNSILTGLLKEQTALAVKYKGQATKRGWMFWGLIFLVIGAVGMRLYLKSKSIIK
jgi:hypothetical protein